MILCLLVWIKHINAMYIIKRLTMPLLMLVHVLRSFQIRYLHISFGRFIQQKLGGPSASEYEKLQAEMSNLQIKYDELVAEHQETCKEVRL